MRHPAVLFLLLAVVMGLILALLPRRTPILAQDQRPAKAPPVAKPQLQGTPSCSASICHGGNDIGERFSETITWQALDPHARAYDTLLSAQSQGIAKHLWNDQTPAHAAPLCLKCHVHPDYEHARPNFRKQDGVGCESCHGAAQDWLKPHYRAAWQQTDRDRLGFADTKHLRGRAEICVTCHVGTPAANVDHDLIAAGHPALRFEFATYLANLPAHWDLARDKKENSSGAGKYIDFEMRAWAIGQSAIAAASTDLLAFRADPANGKAWPEFAEFDCFSCHHDLSAPSWRQKKDHLQARVDQDARRPGSLPWNQWYAKPPGMFANPDRAKIAAHAALYAKAMRGGRLHFPVDRGNGAIDWPNQELGAALHSWDEAAQRYLLLLAIRAMKADNKETDEKLEQRIAELRGQADFAPGHNSPRGFVKKK